jgi:hypothetical protein
MAQREEGFLCFHQGWTDIINSLALINWYLQKYTKLYIIIRNDALDLMGYYTRAHSHNIVYIPTEGNIVSCIGPIEILKLVNINPDNCDFLFHGEFDFFRTDKYTSIYKKNFGKDCFVKSFYSLYDISPSVRVNLFNWESDTELEEFAYQNFISNHGTDYILYHECPEVIKENTTSKYVSLGGISTYFFDMVKVIQNAKEIHLIDSVWATLIYLLQARYDLFSTIPITVYCKRGYVSMYTEPISLQNWNLIYTKNWLDDDE